MYKNRKIEGVAYMKNNFIKNKATGKAIRYGLSNTVILWAMTFPCIISIIMFNYVPLFGWSYAFFNYKPGKSLLQSEFVGLKYFIEILMIPSFCR